MTTQLCQLGCGQEATYTTKGSSKYGPFKGAPVHQCAKHHSACPAIKAQKIATSIEKFGTAYPWQTKEIADKRDATNIEKYGSKCSLKNEGQQAKRKATMIERYGVEEPTMNAEIRDKAAASIKQSYVDDPTLAVRQIQTKNATYGAGWASIASKTKDTQIANGRWVAPEDRTAWAAYKFAVKKATLLSYKLYKDIINPDDLPFGVCDYQIDHIYSVRQGFANNVPPEVIGHRCNLRVIWHTENKSKHIRCDHTIEELTAKMKGA